MSANKNVDDSMYLTAPLTRTTVGVVVLAVELFAPLYILGMEIDMLNAMHYFHLDL